MSVVDQPLVSIIVPSFNQGRFLRDTLDSILSQDYRPLEVLVMDGASTDDSVEILKDYAARHPELRWWSEPDSGVADAVNKGLTLARGSIAGVQSTDDVYRPGAVREAVTLLQQQPEVGVVCGDMDIVDERGHLLLLAPSRLPFSMETFLSRNTIIHQSSTFFRLQLAREAGGWNPTYYCCDTELWLRLAFRTRIVKVDRVWSGWRRHVAQRDREARKMWDSWGRMIAESAELRAAPLRLRLAASAGRRLVALSYNPSRSRLFVAAQAWLAVLTWPPCIRGMYPRAALLPGLGRVQRWLTNWRSTPA